MVCESAPLGPTKELVQIRTPFTHYLFHSLSSHSLSPFFATHNLPSSTQNKDDWPRRRPPPYYSLRARQPGCSRTPAAALELAPPKQDEFFSFPFFRFNRTMTRPSHACRPPCCSRPTCLVARRPFPRACHSCFACRRPYYNLALLAKPTR